ncbi:arginine kinase-like [Bacillus rossius redtenbacheri]|uniref:arginine kinase-like n=1 Tax=Bacillus rossius redtenbacheri TaxID=93214 RepID=UPI002FDCAFAE
MGGLLSKEPPDLDSMFNKFEKTDSKSLLKKHLTRQLFELLKTRRTGLGATLLDVARSGLMNPDSVVGVYVADAESLTVFAELFDPIIGDYHQGFSSRSVHPAKSWGNLNAIGDLDPEGKYVVSTRVRVGRSVDGFPLNPRMTAQDYLDVEGQVAVTLSTLEGELQGEYMSLSTIGKARRKELVNRHLRFKEGDRFQAAANACRFWPRGRGIFLNSDCTFLVWCNEEDHLRIISMQPGGDLGQVYRRLAAAVDTIGGSLGFARHPRLGYVTFCPTNLGTGLRASVHVRLPRLAADRARLEQVATEHDLQVRGTRGEHTKAEGGVYDVSNKRRLGVTEFQAVEVVQKGVLALVSAERALEG